MRPPNEVDMSKLEMDRLIFIIKDRLDLLDDSKGDGFFDADDEKEELMLLKILDKFRKARLKWKQTKDGMWETTLPEGNQLIRVET